jgi:hypothetical protein
MRAFYGENPGDRGEEAYTVSEPEPRGSRGGNRGEKSLKLTVKIRDF